MMRVLSLWHVLGKSQSTQIQRTLSSCLEEVTSSTENFMRRWAGDSSAFPEKQVILKLRHGKSMIRIRQPVALSHTRLESSPFSTPLLDERFSPSSLLACCPLLVDFKNTRPLVNQINLAGCFVIF